MYCCCNFWLVEGDESGKWGQKAAFIKASFVSVGIKDYKCCYGSVLLPHTHHSSTNIFPMQSIESLHYFIPPLAHKHLLWLVMCLICFFIYCRWQQIKWPGFYFSIYPRVSHRLLVFAFFFWGVGAEVMCQVSNLKIMQMFCHWTTSPLEGHISHFCWEDCNKVMCGCDKDWKNSILWVKR